MHLHYISEQNSILNHFLAQIRDVSVQNDSMRFRKNIERIGEIMAYELSKTLPYIDIEEFSGLITLLCTERFRAFPYIKFNHFISVFFKLFTF